MLLHIGAPKAGSSAIQKFCLGNREELAGAGFYYPEHSLDPNGVSGGHVRLGVALLQGAVEEARDLVSEWLDEASRRNLCLLLSGESFFGKPELLRELFSDLKVRVVAYFRSPVEAVISNYCQVIKRHNAISTLEEYVEQQLGTQLHGVSGEIFRRWISCFGSDNLTVFPYSKKAFLGRKIELDFLRLIGVPEDIFPSFRLEERRINSSYVGSALEMKRLLNYVLPKEHHDLAHKIDWALQKYSDDSLSEEGCGFTLSESQFDALLDKFRGTNSYMKESVLEFCPEGFFESRCGISVQSESSYSNPLEALVSVASYVLGHEEFSARLRPLVAAEVSRVNYSSYSLYKLADLLGVPFSVPKIGAGSLTRRQVSICISDDSGKADILRELALFSERIGRIDDARQFIDVARRLRPAGKGIAKIHDRVFSICDQYSVN
ncbi:hypothetical protein [Microbulbifer elongatus]|uniref:hypothetical protein n=1 Tax=Microbulbifer elongatus TaxID=86173 RepID=UPI001CFDF8FB|nr:hypothetical protein [Microbulbifer elongatus]